MSDSTAAPSSLMPAAGEHYPATLAEFRAWFSDDASCLDCLAWLRWPDTVCCPRCDSKEVSPSGTGSYRCSDCWYRVSVTAGTVFHRSRTPLTVWFEAIWLMTAGKTGVSVSHLHRVLPISSYQTAWTVLGKLRSVMKVSESLPLTGRVEVDESLFGGHRAGAPGRGALGKTLVAGAIEVTDAGWGRARLQVIPDASAPSLQVFVQANVAPGAAVATDGWTAYPDALNGYVHEPVNVSASGLPAHESLPAVHRVFCARETND